MEMASRWLSNYSFSGALSSYLLNSFSGYVTEQTTVAIDFSDWLQGAFYLRVRRLSTTVQSIGKSEHQRAVSAGDIKGKAVFGNGIARMQRDRRRFLDD